jgi:hypothetical protein
MDTNIAALANLIALARKDKDDTTKAEISRTTFIDGLIAAGFTAVNVLPKAKLPAGFNGEHMRRKLEVIGIAAIKIKGKRLNDAEIAKYFNDEIGKVVLLAGTAKGPLRNEAGVTQQTWNSELAAWVGKAIKSLAERAADGAAKADGAPKPPKAKREVYLDYLQKAYNMTFKEDNPTDDAEAAQAALQALAKLEKATLKKPTKA